MKKLNWVKVSRNQANHTSALWSKSLHGVMETKVDIDPLQVEELFARDEVKKKKKEEEKPKQPTVVSTVINNTHNPQ